MEFALTLWTVGFLAAGNSIDFSTRICLISCPTVFIAIQRNTSTSVLLLKCDTPTDNTLPTTYILPVFDVHVIVGVGIPVELQSWVNEKDSNSLTLDIVKEKSCCGNVRLNWS